MLPVLGSMPPSEDKMGNKANLISALVGSLNLSHCIAHLPMC